MKASQISFKIFKQITEKQLLLCTDRIWTMFILNRHKVDIFWEGHKNMTFLRY